MHETNLERFHRWFEEVWNQRNDATVDELVSPDAKGYGLSAHPVIGPEIFKEVREAFFATFADLHVEVKGAIASGDVTAGHLVLTGRHVGDDLGVPASGNAVSIPAHVYLVWKEGRIIEAWNLVDMASFYRQAGVIP